MVENKEHIKQNTEDVSSLSNFLEVGQTNFREVNLHINFNEKRFEGNVKLQLLVIDQTVNRVVLDNKGLKIKKVSFFADSLKETVPVKFFVHENHPLQNSLGTPLEVFFPENFQPEKGKSVLLDIEYHTTEKSDGIQWMEKHQTLTGTQPYVFTQCEAILARTVIPCQDSPSAKVVFTKVNLTAEEGITALFGGTLIQKSKTEVNGVKCMKYEYTQKVIIPTYLFAIAAGDIAYKKISDRVGVYTEAPLLDKATEEFKDSEKFIKTAEEYLDYNYCWGDYNILVLPPAFPYGGMENPNLTFLNPSLIVGDKSMVSTVAHEIAHSWTGNLVTNKDWNNFWLNEGFTVFLERKIVEKVYGKDSALLEADVGYHAFNYAVRNFGETHQYTCLHPKIGGEDPDDAFSKVPYEKGFNFLSFIEKTLGEDLFRNILRKYIKSFAYKSIKYQDFQDLLNKEIDACEELSADQKEENKKKIDFDTWVLTPGYLPVTPDYSNNLSKDSLALYNSIVEDKKLDESSLIKHKSEYQALNSKAKIVFLNLILVNIEKIKVHLCPIYEHIVKVTNLNFGNNSNPEIAYTWYQIACLKNDKRAFGNIMDFLKKNGRMKYIKPVYKEFYKAGRNLCLEFFKENKHIYHPVAAKYIEKLFVGKCNDESEVKEN